MHLNIIQSLRSLDLEELTSRMAADHTLAETIHSRKVRQFLLKNLNRQENGKLSWKMNLDVIAESLPAMMDGFSPEILQKGLKITGFPTMFIRGEKSDYIGEEDIELAADIFPGAIFKTIPHAGHWIHAEQPDLFLEAIDNFYSGSNIT